MPRTYGLAKKTIYKYFKTREEFVEAALFFSFDKLFSKVSEIKPNDEKPLEHIFKVMQAIFSHISQITPKSVYDVKLYYPGVWEKIEEFRMGILKTLKSSFMKAQERGLIRKNVDLPFIISLYMRIVQTVFQPEFLIHTHYSLTDIFKRFIDLLMNGLMAKDKTFDFSLIEDQK